MGIATVAVHTTVDQDAMHVRMADEAVCIGKPRSPGNKESYLSISAIISACEITVHMPFIRAMVFYLKIPNLSNNWRP